MTVDIEFLLEAKNVVIFSKVEDLRCFLEELVEFDDRYLDYIHCGDIELTAETYFNSYRDQTEDKKRNVGISIDVYGWCNEDWFLNHNYTTIRYEDLPALSEIKPGGYTVGDLLFAM